LLFSPGMTCKKCGAAVDPQEGAGTVSYECGSCGYRFTRFLTEELGQAAGEVLAQYLAEHPEIEVPVVKQSSRVSRPL
jgi:transposase-like protein